MRDKIEKLLQDVENFTVQSKEQVEEYRIKWLSKKGEITALFDDFREVPNELKKEMGQKLNELRNKAQEKINLLKESFESQNGAKDGGAVDLTLPVFPTLQNG